MISYLSTLVHCPCRDEYIGRSILSITKTHKTTLHCTALAVAHINANVNE